MLLPTHPSVFHWPETKLSLTIFWTACVATSYAVVVEFMYAFRCSRRNPSNTFFFLKTPTLKPPLKSCFSPGHGFSQHNLPAFYYMIVTMWNSQEQKVLRVKSEVRQRLSQVSIVVLRDFLYFIEAKFEDMGSVFPPQLNW